MVQGASLNERLTVETILAQLKWDARVDEENINVDLTDDTVILSGSVPTPSMRRIAAEDAAATGAAHVENRLMIHPGTAPIPDDDIRAAVRRALDWSASVDGSRITVAVNDAYVILEGEVDTCWKKQQVADRVADIIGVQGISNRLAIVPSSSMDDESIGREIAAAFARSGALPQDSITVAVDAGKVTLSGELSDIRDSRRAEMIAGQTCGVTEVVNRLRAR